MLHEIMKNYSQVSILHGRWEVLGKDDAFRPQSETRVQIPALTLRTCEVSGRGLTSLRLG